MNPRSTDCEADALTTTPSRRSILFMLIVAFNLSSFMELVLWPVVLIAVYCYCRPCADKYFCFLLSFEDFIIFVQPFLWFTINLFENI